MTHRDSVRPNHRTSFSLAIGTFFLSQATVEWHRPSLAAELAFCSRRPGPLFSGKCCFCFLLLLLLQFLDWTQGHRATLLTQEVTLGIEDLGVRGIGVSLLAGPLWMQLMLCRYFRSHNCITTGGLPFLDSQFAFLLFPSENPDSQCSQSVCSVAYWHNF